jgi:hypothetical protein
MWSAVKLFTIYSFICAGLNLWIFCDLLYISPFGYLKIEKIQSYLAICIAGSWAGFSIIAIIIAWAVIFRGWDSEQTIMKITILRTLIVIHYILLSIQFITFHAPSFGLLIRYVDNNERNIFKIDKNISELAIKLYS